MDDRTNIEDDDCSDIGLDSARSCPPQCSECRVGPIYRTLRQQNPGIISAARKNTVSYDANRVVIRQDQPSSLVASVRRGWLYRYRRLQNGRQQIIGFIIPGDFLTFSSHSRPEMPIAYGVKSASKTELCVFERDHFVKAVTQEAAFTADFHREFAAYEEQLHRRLADIGQRSASGRLGQLLLELYQRHAARGLIEDNGFEFPVSQELLAKALALTKAYVNRCLSALKRDNVIKLAGQRLTILDMDRLKAIAEEE